MLKRNTMNNLLETHRETHGYSRHNNYNSSLKSNSAKQNRRYSLFMLVVQRHKIQTNTWPTPIMAIVPRTQDCTFCSLLLQQILVHWPSQCKYEQKRGPPHREYPRRGSKGLRTQRDEKRKKKGEKKSIIVTRQGWMAFQTRHGLEKCQKGRLQSENRDRLPSQGQMAISQGMVGWQEAARHSLLPVKDQKTTVSPPSYAWLCHEMPILGKTTPAAGTNYRSGKIPQSTEACQEMTAVIKTRQDRRQKSTQLIITAVQDKPSSWQRDYQ